MTTKSRDRTGVESDARPGLSDERSLPVTRRGAEPGGGVAAEDEWFDETFTAVFSAHARAGRWDAPNHATARGVFGSVNLDFTGAALPEDGFVEIEAVAIFGSVEIRLPDGAEVEILGTPFFGSIEQKRRGKPVTRRLREMVTAETTDYEEEPETRFRIQCTVVFGSVEIFTR
jgi:hypothetical protein